jgi:hypothetical protein
MSCLFIGFCARKSTLPLGCYRQRFSIIFCHLFGCTVALPAVEGTLMQELMWAWPKQASVAARCGRRHLNRYRAMERTGTRARSQEVNLAIVDVNVRRWFQRRITGDGYMLHTRATHHATQTSKPRYERTSGTYTLGGVVLLHRANGNVQSSKRVKGQVHPWDNQILF